MKKSIFLAFVTALVIAGCVNKSPILAPRRPPTPDHISATRADCTECHDKAALPNHKDRTECDRCHKLAPR